MRVGLPCAIDQSIRCTLDIFTLEHFLASVCMRNDDSGFWFSAHDGGSRNGRSVCWMLLRSTKLNCCDLDVTRMMKGLETTQTSGKTTHQDPRSSSASFGSFMVVKEKEEGERLSIRRM